MLNLSTNRVSPALEPQLGNEEGLITRLGLMILGATAPPSHRHATTILTPLFKFFGFRSSHDPLEIVSLRLASMTGNANRLDRRLLDILEAFAATAAPIVIDVI